MLERIQKISGKTKVRKNGGLDKIIYRQILEGNRHKFKFDIVMIKANRVYGRWEMTIQFCVVIGNGERVFQKMGKTAGLCGFREKMAYLMPT